MGAAEAGNEVVFEDSNGAFGGVAAIETGGTSWKSLPFSCMNSLRILDASLSRCWRRGQQPQSIKTVMHGVFVGS
jgi:hypothetical protein